MDVVQLLLNMGAPINSRDRFNGTPLDDAIREGHISVMKELLKCGASFEGVRAALGLCKAASEGDLPMVQLLIEHGADVNKGDNEDRTCLHLAVSCSQITVVGYLLTIPHIDKSPLDKFGGTPLDDAYRHGQLVMATMLQLQGARRGSDMRVLRKKLLAQVEAHRLKQERTKTAAIKKVLDSAEYQALLSVTTTINTMADISQEASRLFHMLMEKIQSLISERSSMSKFGTHGTRTFPLNFISMELTKVMSWVRDSEELMHKMNAAITDCIQKKKKLPSVLNLRLVSSGAHLLSPETTLYAHAMKSFLALEKMVNDDVSEDEDSEDDVEEDLVLRNMSMQVSSSNSSDVQEAEAQRHVQSHKWILETINPFSVEQDQDQAPHEEAESYNFAVGTTPGLWDTPAYPGEQEMLLKPRSHSNAMCIWLKPPQEERTRQAFENQAGCSSVKAIMGSPRLNKSSNKTKNFTAFGDPLFQGYEPDSKTSAAKSVSFRTPVSTKERDEDELQETQRQEKQDSEEHVQRLNLKSDQVFDYEQNHSNPVESSWIGATTLFKSDNSFSKKVINTDNSALQFRSKLENDKSLPEHNDRLPAFTHSIMENVQDLSTDVNLQLPKELFRQTKSESSSNNWDEYKEELITEEQRRLNENWTSAVLGEVLNADKIVNHAIPIDEILAVSSEDLNRGTQHLISGSTTMFEQKSLRGEETGLASSLNPKDLSVPRYMFFP